MDMTGRVSCGVWMMGLPFNNGGDNAYVFLVETSRSKIT